MNASELKSEPPKSCQRCGDFFDESTLGHDALYCQSCLGDALSETAAGQRACQKGIRGGLMYSFVFAFLTYYLTSMGGDPAHWSRSRAAFAAALGAFVWLGLAFFIGREACKRAQRECQFEVNKILLPLAKKVDIYRGLTVRGLFLALPCFASTRFVLGGTGTSNWVIATDPIALTMVIFFLYFTLAIGARKSMDIMIKNLRIELLGSDNYKTYFQKDKQGDEGSE